MLVTGDDHDTFTIALNPGQTLSIQVTPQTAGIGACRRPVRPDGALVGAGHLRLRRRASPCSTGRLVARRDVHDLRRMTMVPGGASGLYDIHLDLNALIKPATSVDTPGGALNLDTSSYTLGSSGDASRVRRGGRPALSHGTAVRRRPGGRVRLNGDVALVSQSSGAILQRFYSPDFSDLYLFDVAIAPDNTFYVLGDLNSYTGVIVHMDLNGNTLGEIISPVSDSPGYLSPEGSAWIRGRLVLARAGQQRLHPPPRLEREPPERVLTSATASTTWPSGPTG